MRAEQSDLADDLELVPTTDWLRVQTRWVRGIGSRWNRLLQSRSLELETLTRLCDLENDQFKNSFAHLVEQQKLYSSKLLTDWDRSLDDCLGSAERQTLESIHHEEQQIAAFKANLKQSELKLDGDYDNKRKSLKAELESAKSNAGKKRDGIRLKLDSERRQIEQQMHDAREWIGVKTSDPVLINWTSHDPHPKADEIQRIPTLSEVAKSLDARKIELAAGISRMESNRFARTFGLPVLIVLGFLLGGMASAVAFSAALPPLIWASIGLVTLFVAPWILSLLVSPWVTRTLTRVFPEIVDCEKETYLLLQRAGLLADQNLIAEVQRLERSYAENLTQLDAKHRETLEQLRCNYRTKKEDAIQTATRTRTSLAETRTQKFNDINEKANPANKKQEARHDAETKEALLSHQSRLTSLRDAYDATQANSVRKWSSGVAAIDHRLRLVRESIKQNYPDWRSDIYNKGEWPRSPKNLAWPIGFIKPEMGLPADDFDTGSLESYLNSLGETTPWPIFYDLLHHGGLLVSTDSDCIEQGSQIVRNVLLRAVTSLPAGKLQTTIIDPEGLGKKFSWLMHVADVDPSLVNHRVWTQPIHIADQLALAARHVEDAIQQSLRNRYRNLYEYNQNAGPMAIPYRLIVWVGFPFGLDDHSWQSLCSILSSGGRCGVGVILLSSENTVWPTFADRKKLKEYGLHLKVPHGASSEIPAKEESSIRATLGVAELEGFPMELISPPDESSLARIMQHHLMAATNIGKRIVPFASIAPDQHAIQRASSADGLEIPIGISDAGRPQLVRLGAGTSQHVLIAGKTGSGKSSLLHTLISSAALNYSPEELRLVLLDFKKGVEFQVYAELGLPHADIIGIESRREFGLSTLEYLDRVLSARGEAFRGWGVQDLPSLKKKHPDIRLPRILIVIDEFQEMFVEDDKLSQQASMLMDRIVRQGRSFGMHLVLASQTLGGAYSLPRTTLSQMAVRIALQCDSSDAMLILSEDNTAAERLRYSGQGIYNEIGGRIEGNQNFQGSFLQKVEQLERLSALPHFPVPHSTTTNALGRRIIFEGHKPATWDSVAMQSAFADVKSKEPSSIPWILGDSVSIEPPIVRQFTRNAGRNAMIVASEDRNVASLIASWIAGTTYLTTEAKEAGDSNRLHGSSLGKFVILDGCRPEDINVQQVLSWLPECDASVRLASARDAELTLAELNEELDRRNAQPTEVHPAIYLVILNLSRFRELRRSEDFSFGASDGEAIKPDAVLAKLLADGPPLGIHVCIWADSATSLSRWLSRASLRDIEIRILSQMSAADSNQLIDSNIANRLDKYVMLVHDDIDGKSIKFRPFMLESIRDQNRS
jgi:hypothetical protein